MDLYRSADSQQRGDQRVPAYPHDALRPLLLGKDPKQENLT